jgi:hypothetical protein
LICTQFYEGQGLGNQLWAYVTLRVIAERKSLTFGVVNPQYFKGFPFLNLDFGEFIELPPNSDPNDVSVLPVGIKYLYVEEQEFDSVSGLDITHKTIDLEQISDSTKIQGNFQNHTFVTPFKAQIKEWLKPTPPNFYTAIDDNVCVINFRGGEYRHWKALFLDKHYWHRARRIMSETVPGIKFRVVTDDPELAKYFFPVDEIVNSGIAEDFLAIFNAKYLIVSNSSFAWFPAWLNENVKICIAPKFWAGYKLNQFWSCGYTFNPDWVYLDSSGSIFNLEQSIVTNDLKQSIKLKFDRLLVPTRLLRNTKMANFRNLCWLPRRRRARTWIWVVILLKKLLGIRIYSSVTNMLTNIKKKTNYSSLQYPYFSTKSKGENSRALIDAFYFMNEFEILQLRLEMLSKFVDKFVILEAKHTFTGLEKRPHLTDNLHLFEKYSEKIQVFVVDIPYFTRSDFYSAFFDKNTDLVLRQICSRTLTSKNVPPGDSHWVREFFNKECLLLALQEFSPDAQLVVSDVDEIWNPKRLPISMPSTGTFVYKQHPYIYMMNNLSNESWRNWTGSVTATLESFLRDGINNSRTHHKLPRRVIRSGGWHFSFQGGAELIKTKLESYGHQELNTQTNRDLVLKFQTEIEDIRRINAKFKKNERLLPPEVIALKKRLPNWFI